MTITDKRIANHEVTLPFSEREFLYKLKRIKDSMMIDNRKNEIPAINKLISSAKIIFNNEPKGKQKYGRSIEKKLKIQMQPKTLKRNLLNLNEFEKIFKSSPLQKNEEISLLLYNTGRKIRGRTLFAQFERKSFIHELEKITRKLKDKHLIQQLDEEARRLPTSKDNVSAFIVKYGNNSNEKILSNLLIGGVCSIDHLIAKKNGGKNKLYNYGLTSIETNRKKANILFSKWVKNHPEIKQNCQKYIDRLIELYKRGIFDRVNMNSKNKKLDKSYIENFAKVIYDLSPEENRIELNISKLYE